MLLILIFFVFNSGPDWCKTEEMCDKVIYEEPFMLIYCPDRYKPHKMHDKAVDDCLAA